MPLRSNSVFPGGRPYRCPGESPASCGSATEILLFHVKQAEPPAFLIGQAGSRLGLVSRETRKPGTVCARNPAVSRETWSKHPVSRETTHPNPGESNFMLVCPLEQSSRDCQSKGRRRKNDNRHQSRGRIGRE